MVHNRRPWASCTKAQPNRLRLSTPVSAHRLISPGPPGVAPGHAPLLPADDDGLPAEKFPFPPPPFPTPRREEGTVPELQRERSQSSSVLERRSSIIELRQRSGDIRFPPMRVRKRESCHSTWHRCHLPYSSDPAESPKFPPALGTGSCRRDVAVPRGGLIGRRGRIPTAVSFPLIGCPLRLSFTHFMLIHSYMLLLLSGIPLFICDVRVRSPSDLSQSEIGCGRGFHER